MAAQTLEVVSPRDFGFILKLQTSVWLHAFAAELLTEGEAEGVVRTEYNGVRCQIRMDWFSAVHGLVDLKTCDDLTWFESDARRFGYAGQLAFYRAVLRMVLGINVPVHIIAVEKKEPFRTGVWLLTGELLDLAEVENIAAIDRLKVCRQTRRLADGLRRSPPFRSLLIHQQENTCHYSLTFKAARRTSRPGCWFTVPKGSEKHSPLDAQVLTPEGFVAMGELKVGDRVIGVDGKPRNILAIFPQGKKEVFRVHFRDGSQTECCDEHLWFTQTRGERERHQPERFEHSILSGGHFATGHTSIMRFRASRRLNLLPAPNCRFRRGCSVFISATANMSGCPIITNPEEDIRRRITESVDEFDATSPTEKAIRIRKRLRRA